MVFMCLVTWIVNNFLIYWKIF